MFVFNGKKYAKNDDEFTSSLFDAGGTCSGFYKRTKNGIRLFNMQREPMAFIVLHEPLKFIVTMFKFEEKIRFMFSMSTSTAKFLGFDNDPGMMDQDRMIREAMKQFA